MDVAEAEPMRKSDKPNARHFQELPVGSKDKPGFVPVPRMLFFAAK